MLGMNVLIVVMRIMLMFAVNVERIIMVQIYYARYALKSSRIKNCNNYITSENKHYIQP